MNTLQSITIDLLNPGTIKTAHMKQFDAGTRELSITLTAGGAAWNVPSGAALLVGCQKPDTTRVLYDSIITAAPTGGISATVDAAAWAASGLSSAVFTFNGTAWMLSGASVDLADYGVTVAHGTPASGNTITVSSSIAVSATDNVLTVKVSRGCLTIPGSAKLDVFILNGGEQIGTFSVTLIIEKAVADPSMAITDESYVIFSAQIKAYVDEYLAEHPIGDAGDIAYDPDETYPDGTVGAAIASIISSVNMADPSEFVTGALQSDGSISTNGTFANYATSAFIKLAPNTDYDISRWYRDTILQERLIYLLYDSTKTPVSSTYVSQGNTRHLTFNSAAYSYVRISAINIGNMQIIIGTEPGESFVPYKLTMNCELGGAALQQIEDLIPNPKAQDILYNKKWAVCGDSFTFGATDTKISDGKYDGENYVYPYLIGNRTNINVLKFFESGRTLAFPAEPGTFTNSLTNPSNTEYYQNIPVDADYITIYLGINDSHHENGQGGDDEDPTGVIPLGTISDDTTATYYGAWNVVLTWLIANRPFAHIGIIVSNGCDRVAYRTAQIEIATKYGIPYIDMNGDSKTPVMIRSLNTDVSSAVRNAVNQKQAVNYPSNTHPNDNAHLYESYFIESFLKSI